MFLRPNFPLWLKKPYILFQAQPPLIAQSPIVARRFLCFEKIVAHATKRVNTVIVLVGLNFTKNVVVFIEVHIGSLLDN